MSEAADLSPRLAGVVHRNRPVCDGFCFDDLYGLSWEERQRAIDSGLVYATEFKAVEPSGKIGTFAGTILAKDWHAAEADCDRRMLGERVVTQLGGIYRP